MKAKELGIRSISALVGVAVLAFGSAMLRVSNVGLDPYTSANIGMGNFFHLSLGVYQLMVNLGILVMIFLFARKYIGAGTIINMVLTGFFIDFFTMIFNAANIAPEGWFIRGVFLIVGVLIFTFGASFYMSANIGTAPYDAIAPMIVDKTGINYRIVRVAQDVIFALLGLIFAGPIGIGTFICAFLVGPLIKFWDEKVSQPVVEKSVARFL